MTLNLYRFDVPPNPEQVKIMEEKQNAFVLFQEKKAGDAPAFLVSGNKSFNFPYSCKKPVRKKFLPSPIQT